MTNFMRAYRKMAKMWADTTCHHSIYILLGNHCHQSKQLGSLKCIVVKLQNVCRS